MQIQTIEEWAKGLGFTKKQIRKLKYYFHQNRREPNTIWEAYLFLYEVYVLTWAELISENDVKAWIASHQKR